MFSIQLVYVLDAKVSDLRDGIKLLEYLRIIGIKQDSIYMVYDIQLTYKFNGRNMNCY